MFCFWQISSVSVCIFFLILFIFWLHFFLLISLQENVPLEEVFQTLRCDSNGLTTESAEERLAIFGHNKLEEKKVFRLNFFSLFSVERWFVFADVKRPFSLLFDGKM